jgi:HK97 family phage major capsid protein
MPTRSKPRAKWYINTDCNPELDNIALAVGTGGIPPRFIDYNDEGAMRIKGRPVVETEFNATLGTAGDIILADMSQYLFFEKGPTEVASSIHVQFLTDQEVFRFVKRVDGTLNVASALTPFKGSNTLSPVLTLASRT